MEVLGSSGLTDRSGRQAFNPAFDLHMQQVFGDGSDGDVTISGAVTLARDMNYRDLTFAAGASLNLNGFAPRVSRNADITAIPSNGMFITNSTGTTAAAQAAGGSVTAIGVTSGLPSANASAGQSGSTALAATLLAQVVITLLGGRGGRGGRGGASSTQTTGVTPPAIPVVSAQPESVLRRMLASLAGQGIFGASYGSPGNGGNGDGSQGGGSGSPSPGAATLYIPWRNIIRGASAAAGAIVSKALKAGSGGPPVAGGSRGGGAGSGGGGGAAIILIYMTITGATATNLFDVSGGDGGDGGNGTGTGTGGDGGNSGEGGILWKMDLTALTLTKVDSGVGSNTGTAASGVTGGAGAVATTARISL